MKQTEYTVDWSGQTPVKPRIISKVYIPVAIMAGVIIITMGYILYTGNKMTAVHAPLVDASMEIKLNVSLGHLWFEEISSGDRSEGIDSVMNYFDEADWYCEAMLFGGENAEGKFIPLENEDFRQEITLVQSMLDQFRKISLDRWNSMDQTGVGAEIDQKYDSLFKDVLEQTDKVETVLQQTMKQQLERFKALQSILIAVCLLGSVFIGILFRRFLLKEINDKLKLWSMNQQLDAVNQQLQASEQQLLASEQQLRANNELLLSNQSERESFLEQLRTKNDEMEKLLSIVSHDLRAPLSSIEGFTYSLITDSKKLMEMFEKIADESLLAESAKIQEDFSESRHFISTSVSKMDKLLKGLSSLAKVGSMDLKKENLDMNNLIRQVVDSMKYQVDESGTNIYFDDLPGCMGDDVQINQVFSNLLGNALKYRHPERPCEIHVSGSVENNTCIYRVEDNCIGIPTSHQDKVFDVYHRVDYNTPVDGEGLGLSAVKRIIERHNGNIRLESAEGQGTTFYVSIPTMAGVTQQTVSSQSA